MVRMAGFEVRYKNVISDSSVPSKIAISRRIVKVAINVARATVNSTRLKTNTSRQRAMSNKNIATISSKPASAAVGILASNALLTATKTNNKTAEKTAASGVRAPACKLGMERFIEPHDT